MNKCIISIDIKIRIMILTKIKCQLKHFVYKVKDPINNNLYILLLNLNSPYKNNIL